MVSLFYMNDKTKEIVATFFSLLIIRIIEVSVIMLCWNYILHEVFNANKASLLECLVFLLLVRFTCFGSALK